MVPPNSLPQLPTTLPPGCHLRPATAEDAWAIRALVLRAWLDPTQLRWQQFWVVEHDGGLIACGQLRQFEGAQELGSLVVAPQWRRQGLGTYLSVHLTSQAIGPLYLECLGKQLAQFYRRLGFVEADLNAMPPSIRRKFRLSYQLSRTLRLPLSILEYQGSPQ